MNKVINGKRYDTDKAEQIAQSDNGCYVGDLDSTARLFTASAPESSSCTPRAGRARGAPSATARDGPAARR